MENTINDIRELVNPELEIMGVIATLYKVRVKDQNEILGLLQEKYNVIGIIRETSEAVKGIYDGLAVVERNRNFQYLKSIRKSQNILCLCKVSAEACATYKNHQSQGLVEKMSKGTMPLSDLF